MDSPFLRQALAGFVVAQTIYLLANRDRRRAALRRLFATPRRRAPDKRPPARRRTQPSDALPPVRTERLFGLSVAASPANALVERLIAWADEVPARTCIVATLDHAAALAEDPVLNRAVADADVITPGERVFLWLADQEGDRLAGRLAGEDLLPPLARAAASEGRSLFLIGVDHAGLHGLAKELKSRHPRLEFCGIYALPHGFERDIALHRELLSLLRTARPDIVLALLDHASGPAFCAGMADAVRHGVFIALDQRPDRLMGEGGTSAWTRLARALRNAVRLPGLYLRHKRDRREHLATERRRALAVLSDRRYREAREAARQEARERSSEAQLERGPLP